MNDQSPAGGEASAGKEKYSYSDLVIAVQGRFASHDRVLCPVGAGCPCSDPEANPRGAGPGVRRDEIGGHIDIKHPDCELVDVPAKKQKTDAHVRTFIFLCAIPQADFFVFCRDPGRAVSSGGLRSYARSPSGRQLRRRLQTRRLQQSSRGMLMRPPRPPLWTLRARPVFLCIIYFPSFYIST